MGLKSLALSLTMDGETVVVDRSFGISIDETVMNKDELVEALSVSILRGLNDKPEILKGMLHSLLDGVEKQRRNRR